MVKDAYSVRLATLWPSPKSIQVDGEMAKPRRIGLALVAVPEWFIDDLERSGVGIDRASDFKIYRLRSDAPLAPQGYEILIDGAGVGVAYRDESGLRYALVTLSQIFSLFSKTEFLPRLRIEDAPLYENRSLMVDLGRTIWTLPMLKRSVRMMFRMKLNVLHLHLFDDELCGVRFKTLPLGSENPYALTLDEIAELMTYAKEYGVRIMAEVETWGHVGSVVYHYPELNGGPGMYGGASFLICQKTFELVRALIEEVVDALPELELIHLGLDEAHWFLGTDVQGDFTPSDLIALYEEMVEEIGRARGREFRLFAYADHGGRPLPEASRIILQPWNYWIHNQDGIDAAVAKYSLRDDKLWFPMAGQSMAQHRSAFQATRHWGKRAAFAKNVWGIDIAMWGRNDLGERFLTVFAGAQFAWNPLSVNEVANIPDPEVFDARVHPVMQFHQAFCIDLNPIEWQKDGLPFVYRGRYLWGARHGAPVAPTVTVAGIDAGQAFYAEGAAESDEA